MIKFIIWRILQWLALPYNIVISRMPRPLYQNIDYALKNNPFGVKTSQLKPEIGNMLTIIRAEKPKVIVEIGTRFGGTLFLMAKVAPKDCIMISIDIEKFPLHRRILYKKMMNQKLHFVTGDSGKQETVEKLKKILGNRKIGFLFIDGDHEYKAVKKDHELYKPLVNGHIGFHDICEHYDADLFGVDWLWNEIKKHHKHHEFIESDIQKWAGIGVVEHKD